MKLAEVQGRIMLLRPEAEAKIGLIRDGVMEIFELTDILWLDTADQKDHCSQKARILFTAEVENHEPIRQAATAQTGRKGK
jgi:hypothetical protein